MNHCINLALLLLLCSIYQFPQTLAAASSSPNKTGDAGKPPPDLLHKPVISGDGSAITENNKSSITGDGEGEVKKPVVAAKETCELAKDSNRCHDDALNVTACIFHAGDVPESLLVVNDGHGSLKFNFTIPPSEVTSDYRELAAHNVNKINLSASVNSASSSVILKAENWTCTIRLKDLLPPPLPLPPPSPSYSYAAAYATPINGVYLFLGTSLLIGLILGCYKYGKFRRRSEMEVPYQQLEMGNNNVQSTSAVDVEAGGGGGGGGGWDQDWDDDWDEGKAVRTPGGNHVVNSGSRFAESNGWDDDWKD